jgi:hypothetical protein
MGMIGNLIRVSNDELLTFKNDSSQLEDLIYAEESFSEPWYLDLDKTWEALHFLLSGKSIAETSMNETPNSVLETVIFSPQLIDKDQDLGFGPASFNNPVQVKEIFKKLNELDLVELEQKYNGQLLNDSGVYPEVWIEQESKEYLFDNLKSLISFYKEAATNDEVVIGFIN